MESLAALRERRAADPGWRRLLDHLAMAGPSDIDSLRLELGLKRQELKALRAPLERCGVIVARSMTMTAERGDGHAHVSELSRWDQAFPGGAAKGAEPADPAAALADLLVAAVKAAVLAPEPGASGPGGAGGRRAGPVPGCRGGSSSASR
jgi:hypothetical protein